MANAPLTPDLLIAGSYLAAAVLDWSGWCHRKVESIDLMEGQRGRRRVSLDCSPRRLTWREPGSSYDSALVPLTFMSKSTLREFDVTDDAGRSVPILGKTSNGLLAAAALAFLVGIEHQPSVAEKFWDQICEVTFGEPDAAEIAARDLLGEVTLGVATATLIRDLSRNFILIAVVPSESSERRQVIKYSYHWKSSSARVAGLATWWAQVRAGLGFGNFQLSVALDSLDSASSYHLECSAPPGLLCTRVELPPDSNGIVPVDELCTPVGHARGSYDVAVGSGNNATISFVIDQARLPTRIFLSALGVSALFFFLWILPKSFDALSHEIDASTALFLFGPAVLIVLGARASENDIVARLLLLLRMVAYGLCLALFVAGGMLVLQFPEQVIRAYWVVAFVVSAALGLTVLIGVFRLKVIGSE